MVDICLKIASPQMAWFLTSYSVVTSSAMLKFTWRWVMILKRCRVTVNADVWMHFVNFAFSRWAFCGSWVSWRLVGEVWSVVQWSAATQNCTYTPNSSGIHFYSNYLICIFYFRQLCHYESYLSISVFIDLMQTRVVSHETGGDSIPNSKW